MDKEKIKFIAETATELRAALEDLKDDIEASEEEVEFDIDEFIENANDIETTFDGLNGNN